jgi:hypothetical protein
MALSTRNGGNDLQNSITVDGLELTSLSRDSNFPRSSLKQRLPLKVCNIRPDLLSRALRIVQVLNGTPRASNKNLRDKWFLVIGDTARFAAMVPSIPAEVVDLAIIKISLDFGTENMLSSTAHYYLACIVASGSAPCSAVNLVISISVFMVIHAITSHWGYRSLCSNGSVNSS